jgi:hypothetical protein
MKKFSITRVVTKDIITDSFQGLRNLFGLRLRGYEKMLNRHINELIRVAEEQYNIKWFRLSINPLAKGSAMITIYGEYDG